ncbi:2-oxoadipate dioxygenase/decarboxylase HglS [Pseudomonas mangiferae]|uniref:2-oxoadipate dioxygenase/decarboxylase n=1 Tax=Pseudomonas mangiferae TaxID=2593654 RepID=A0A553GV60_9PSED|nr:VOC family protein [Pseudomonas mangiferae]TRX73369.1 VOC family protein [Pseudomonas mangiferae]
MTAQAFVPPDEIRARFSQAMSNLYRSEVPLYGELLALVAEVNRNVLADRPALAEQLALTGERERLDLERHGAIRVGTADELATLRRLFAVMGMQPVGYYDLSTAGVPVHSTAFRAVHEDALQRSPFRVFTSLLRLELIDDPALRERATALLARRRIFTPEALRLIETHERDGGLEADDAVRFVVEALETFRWHRQATVDAETYRQLNEQHRLVADVVAFKGPHINHLTPRTLDIDAVQRTMPTRGITPKAVIEGPPPRTCPILLRQTSFKALQEEVAFLGSDGEAQPGSHTARFGEIEQRGAALTPAGRALYDRLLASARTQLDDSDPERYLARLSEHFAEMPDDYEALRQRGLAYFRYFPTRRGLAARQDPGRPTDLDALLDAGHLTYEPLVYEDFLPVSAAGIFQSNLGEAARGDYSQGGNRSAFEAALGSPVQDELALYAASQRRSLRACADALGLAPEALSLEDGV